MVGTGFERGVTKRPTMARMSELRDGRRGRGHGPVGRQQWAEVVLVDHGRQSVITSLR